MPLNIAYEFPASHGLRRFRRCVASLVGAVLILIGLLVAAPLTLVLIVVVAAPFSGFEMPDLTEGWGLLAGSAAASVVCLTIGMALVRGKRRLVLFLRRFGFVGATQALTFALATAMGSSWRLATLDDAQVAPLGVHHRARWLTLGGGVVAVLALAALLYWVFGGGFVRTLGDVMERVAEEQDNPLAGLVAALVVGLAVAAFLLALVLLPAGFIGAGALFFWSSYGSVRRAEGAKAVEVMEEREVEEVARSVARRGRNVFSPRLVVVRVATRYWQQVVHRMASESAALIVDVSEPTENLLWELETLMPEFGPRCILVGEDGRLKAMNAAARGTPSPLVLDLFTAVGDEDVLAYAGDRGSRKRFARALRAKLESL